MHSASSPRARRALGRVLAGSLIAAPLVALVPAAGHAAEAASGNSSWTTFGEAASALDPGLLRSFTTGNSVFTLDGAATGVTVGVNATGGAPLWTARFEPGAGNALTAGTTYTDSMAAEPDPYTGARLIVAPQDGACVNGTGTFTVREAAYTDDALTAFAATFAQKCDGKTGNLYGTIAWQAAAPALALTSVPGILGAAPEAVRSLVAKPGFDEIKLTWLNARTPDWDSTVVRIAAGTVAPATLTSGTGVYAGTGTTATAKNLKPGSTYTISMFSKDSEGRWARTSRTVNGSATTFKLSTTKAVYGKKVMVRGELHDRRTGKPLAGQAVRIWVQKPGIDTWYSGPSAKTTSTGTYSIAFYPDRAYVVYVFYDGGTNLGSGAGAPRVNVAPQVAIDQQYTKVKRGTKFGLGVYVFPAKDGQKAQLQQLVGGKWKKVQDVKLYKSKWTDVYRTSASAGTLKFRVYRAAEGGRTAAVSKSVTITVT